MDVLEQFFSGGKTAAEPTKSQSAKGASVITDQLLDSLRRVESGKDRFAINKETKAMGPYQFMPETVQMLHKQGIEFNPFNEQQAREAAKTYLGQLVDRNKGDVNKALAQYGGFVTKDPSQYVSNVLGGAKETPQAAPAAQTGDPLEAFLSGKTIAAPTPSAPVTTQPTTASTTSTQEGTMGEYAPRRQPVGQVRQLVGKFLKSALETKQEMPERVAGAIDTLYGVVPATYGAFVQGLARSAQSPELAEQTGQAAAASIDKPVGKFFGLTGKETYQKPLGGITEPVIEQVKKMAEQLGMTPKQISEKTGIPEQDIKNMVVIGSVAVPQALREAAPIVKEAVQAVTTPIKQAAAELQVVKPGQLTKEQAQAQFEAKQAPAGSAGAAAAQNNPFFGKITGEEVGGSETFPQVKLTKISKDVPVPEQQLRSQMFQEVLPGLKPRPGVVTGNDNLLRNEHALANMAEPTPLGLKMKEQIANEQIGLSKFAEDRVNATGASRSLINDEQRGERINNVFHGVDPDDISGSSIMGYLNQSKREIYKSAFKENGNNAIKTTHIDNFLNDPLEITTFKAAGQKQLLESAKDFIDLARTTGFKMPDGTFLPPSSVSAYDHVKKIFNSDKIWNRDRASLIRDINGAIDQDISAVADPSLYKLGDNIHRLEKQLFKSKGIDKIFGEADKNGVITSATALEKIPQKLNDMPKDQWRHVRDTLNELAQGRIRNAPEGMPPVPKELQESARAAVAEIDGALAREVYKAGAKNVGEWSSKKANDVMNSTVGQKIVETFSPDEVQKFHALNYVGQFTPGLKYEGAALQQRRVSLLEKNYPAFGATVGSGLGAVIGESPLSKEAALGGFIGREAGAYLQAKKRAKEETKAMKKMEKEMEKASALGKQTGKNKLEDLNK
jgi:Transglycosylase SLT domain